MNSYDELHAYVDGELEPSDRRRVESWIASDPDARRHVDAIQDTKRMVERHCAPVECRAAWTACRGRIAEIERARRVERFVSRNAWAICAGLAVAIIGVGSWTRANAPKTLQNADFVHAVAGFGGSDPGSPTQNLNHFMDALLKRAKEAQASDAMLASDQISGVMDGHRFVKTRLTDKSGDMWLICVEDPITVEGMAASSDLPGFGLGKMGANNCVHVVVDGRSTFLAGSREYADLARALTRICASR